MADIEYMARSLNDDWGAHPTYGASWDDLDESEREHWRDVTRFHLGRSTRVAELEAQCGRILDVLWEIVRACEQGNYGAPLPFAYYIAVDAIKREASRELGREGSGADG